MSEALSGTDRFSPTLADLITTVRDFLKDVGARPGRGLAYDSHVARYLLDMSLRELASGAALDRHSADRIAALLGDEADVPDPVATLCHSIRTGVFDDRWEEFLRVILADTAERVAIIRPDVLAPEHSGAELRR